MGEREGVDASRNVYVGVFCNLLRVQLKTSTWLPYVIGRSKKAALAFVKDNMTAKVKDWEGRILNPAGKQVLGKSVLLIMPIYVMYPVLKFQWAYENNSLQWLLIFSGMGWMIQKYIG